MENRIEQTEEYGEIVAETGRLYSSIAEERDELLESIREDFYPATGRPRQNRAAPSKAKPSPVKATRRRAESKPSRPEAKEETV